ncbi:hypothetical protein P154DRAFT_39066 [Amniculicola lignicola CBS 123094]|uniref:RING-type domain-containing protein n=1 Tax=Amniculicola lignicola CBS 123094 TaxID=1392246 RepID=A0A6A5W1Z6_9PLEO|nr:hypothetical protein P154DRAFT_39066 [Amniculicola lignicola CBS 123094]
MRNTNMSSVRPASPSASSDSTERVPTPPVGDLIDLSSDIEDEAQCFPPPTPHPDLEGLHISTTLQVSAPADVAEEPEEAHPEPSTPTAEAATAVQEAINVEGGSTTSIPPHSSTNPINPDPPLPSDKDAPDSRRRRLPKGQSSDMRRPSSTSLLSSSEPSTSRSGQSSINNPRLLDAVEDAIRRLIIPELSALKEEERLKKSKKEGASPNGGLDAPRSRKARSRDIEGPNSQPRTSERKERRYSRRTKVASLSTGSLVPEMERRHSALDTTNLSVDDIASTTAEVAAATGHRKNDAEARRIRRRQEKASKFRHAAIPEEGVGANPPPRSARYSKAPQSTTKDGKDIGPSTALEVPPTNETRKVPSAEGKRSTKTDVHTPIPQVSENDTSKRAKTSERKILHDRTGNILTITTGEGGNVRVRATSGRKGKEAVDRSHTGNLPSTPATSPYVEPLIGVSTKPPTEASVHAAPHRVPKVSRWSEENDDLPYVKTAYQSKPSTGTQSPLPGDDNATQDQQSLNREKQTVEVPHEQNIDSDSLSPSHQPPGFDHPKSIPIWKYSKISRWSKTTHSNLQSRICSICAFPLDDGLGNERIDRLSCNHECHGSCLDQMKKPFSARCATCNAPIQSQDPPLQRQLQNLQEPKHVFSNGPSDQHNKAATEEENAMGIHPPVTSPFHDDPHYRDVNAPTNSPFSPSVYDVNTFQSDDRITSKDVLALMDHLNVRDAQRNARDTEVLSDLVRSAAEMRDSYEAIKKQLQQDEARLSAGLDQKKDIAAAGASHSVLYGPRPFPAAKVGRGEEDAAQNKRKNVFKRALQGIAMKGKDKELAELEKLLEGLLAEVEDLKTRAGVDTPKSHSQEIAANDHVPPARANTHRIPTVEEHDSEFSDDVYHPPARPPTPPKPSTRSFSSTATSRPGPFPNPQTLQEEKPRSSSLPSSLPPAPTTVPRKPILKSRSGPTYPAVPVSAVSPSTVNSGSTIPSFLTPASSSSTLPPRHPPPLNRKVSGSWTSSLRNFRANKVGQDHTPSYAEEDMQDMYMPVPPLPPMSDIHAVGDLRTTRTSLLSWPSSSREATESWQDYNLYYTDGELQNVPLTPVPPMPHIYTTVGDSELTRSSILTPPPPSPPLRSASTSRTRSKGLRPPVSYLTGYSELKRTSISTPPLPSSPFQSASTSRTKTKGPTPNTSYPTFSRAYGTTKVKHARESQATVPLSNVPEPMFDRKADFSRPLSPDSAVLSLLDGNPLDHISQAATQGSGKDEIWGNGPWLPQSTERGSMVNPEFYEDGLVYDDVDAWSNKAVTPVIIRHRKKRAGGV